jgi:biopolymer transport protein ExbB
MKYLHNILLTSLMVHFLPLAAEEISPELTTEIALEEEAEALTSLDEELSHLDEEFEEFKEELASSDETPLVQPVELKIDEVTAVEPETPAVIQPALLETQTPSEDLVTQSALPEEALAQDTPATLNVESTAIIGEKAPLNKEAITVDLEQAFAGSPIIYSVLFAMSVFSLCLWLYSILSMRSSAKVSSTLLKSVQNKLSSNNFEEALFLCEENNNLFCKMVSSGIQSRRHGLPVMIEAMKAEGKRATISYWQKIGMLNDIAIIAPMIGLLGTVLGMFYAFYDVNRSIESISTLFDGLGVSVGTTVAGLLVAIVALILHSTAKYRLVQALAQVENNAQKVATLIDDRTSISKG